MLGATARPLRAVRQPGRTLIVVTADHGESLGEHGETTHGLFAYDATLAVPLIVTGRRIPAGASDDPVATRRHRADDPRPRSASRRRRAGRPVAGAAAARGSRDLLRGARCDAHARLGAADRPRLRNGWKYIDLPDAELYDLRADPARAARTSSSAIAAPTRWRAPLSQMRAARADDRPARSTRTRPRGCDRSATPASAALPHSGARRCRRSEASGRPERAVQHRARRVQRGPGGRGAGRVHRASSASGPIS